MDENISKYYNQEIAKSCYFGEQLVKELFNEEYQVYQKIPEYLLSSKKLEGLKRIAALRVYYLRNPIRFIKDFFNIELLDFQCYMIVSAWDCPNVILLCSRGAGKSTFSDLLIMAKQMLMQNWVYIASGSGSQAEQTFTTLERIANDRIDSMVGSTGYIFKNEVEVPNASGDGFSHSSDGFTYNLYNGSFTKTLNSSVDKKRGARSNIVLFDECGWLDSHMLETYKAFTIVDKDFKTGSINGKSLDQMRLRSLPREMPNQLIYISSASSTDTEFYRLYRDFSKRMLLGDNRYFVAQIDCEITINPTLRGKKTAPLLTRDKVETALRVSSEKALREYYCTFTTDAGAEAIVKRGVITRNEETRKPLLMNDTGEKKFILTYDPARSRDNSVILIVEVYGFGTGDIKGRIVNCVNLLDVGKKIKSPMQTPDQINYLKQLLLDYNGPVDDYQNILGVYIDAGSGGAGVNIADYLMDDWTDKDGNKHRGIIDKEYSEDYVKKYPNAVPILHLMSPSKYKSEMYEALIELLNQDKISFTSTYDNKGYLMVQEIDHKLIDSTKDKILKDPKNSKKTQLELDKIIQNELGKLESVSIKRIPLDWQEELSLTNIDALKEELVNMIRKKRESGKDGFELTPDKANRLNDDRSYCASMVGYALSLIRRQDQIANRKSRLTVNQKIVNLPMRSGNRRKMYTDR